MADAVQQAEKERAEALAEASQAQVDAQKEAEAAAKKNDDKGVTVRGRARFVNIKHEDGSIGSCPEEALPVYEPLGWSRDDSKDRKTRARK